MCGPTIHTAIAPPATSGSAPDGADAPVRIQARSTSATLQACATQPRDVNGGSASKISLIEPIVASPRCASNPDRKRRAPALSSGWVLSHASINGPISQAQTVPWW